VQNEHIVINYQIVKKFLWLGDHTYGGGNASFNADKSVVGVTQSITPACKIAAWRE
jgi:hypothetical protein